MEDVTSCFLKLRTISGDLETPFVYSPFSMKKGSSSKICWLELSDPAIKNFIDEVYKRQYSRKARMVDFSFDLITETMTLTKCRLDFNIRKDLGDGAFILFVKRKDNI